MYCHRIKFSIHPDIQTEILYATKILFSWCTPIKPDSKYSIRTFHILKQCLMYSLDGRFMLKLPLNYLIEEIGGILCKPFLRKTYHTFFLMSKIISFIPEEYGMC